jgi:hypothetical protein
MAKRKIVEINGKNYVSIPLTKKVLIEGKIVDKGTRLLVEEEGVVDTIQTNADIASASSSDFDEIYTMRRPFARMDADDFPPETEVVPVGPSVEDYDAVMSPEERFEMRRRLHCLNKDEGDTKDKLDKEEEKDKLDKDEEDKAEMRRRLYRMRARMDDEEKDKLDKDEEDKDKLDKDEEDKDKMRARMRMRMRARMDKDEEEKNKLDKDEDDKE